MSNRVFSFGWLGCCCAGCSTNILAEFCGVNLAGVLITVKSGGTTVASGTTDSTGNVVLTIPSAGTYTVIGTIAGFTTVSTSKSLTCGGMTGVLFTLPTTLFLTDSSTTVTMTWDGSSSWLGCYLLAEASASPTVTFPSRRLLRSRVDGRSG